MSLAIASIKTRSVGDHADSKLDVLIGERHKRAIELLEHNVDLAKLTKFQFTQLLVKMTAAG